MVEVNFKINIKLYKITKQCSQNLKKECILNKNANRNLIHIINFLIKSKMRKVNEKIYDFFFKKNSYKLINF